MVKQKLYAINPDSIWCIGARGKCYEAYLGRDVRRSQLRLGGTVEVEFHNHKAYIFGVCE